MGAMHQSVSVTGGSDPVRLWRDRLVDCFDGLARAAPAYDAKVNVTFADQHR
jgi:hypothetical protein